MESLRVLLRGIVDYAGLFPPAGLAMMPAVRNYAEYWGQDEAWMLGRFVVPAARLAEFREAAVDLLPDAGSPPWQLSALAGDDLATALESVAAHNASTTLAGAGSPVVSLELKADSPAQIEAALATLPKDLEVFFELPVEPDPAVLIAALRGSPARAKIRTGGVSGPAFPSSEQTARFILGCAQAGVPFKATAGLHHPLRGLYRLSYEADSGQGLMFGYLNVFLAAAYAVVGRLGEHQLLDLLAESDADNFVFDDQGSTWRGVHLSLRELAEARARFAFSFGSCSFVEPVDDLQALGLLPTARN